MQPSQDTRKFAQNSPVEGLEVLNHRPLDPAQVDQQVQALLDRKQRLAPKITVVKDTGLLEDQKLSLSTECPVNVIILGGAGSLASGYLSRGVAELNNFLKQENKSSCVQYIMCDIYDANDQRVEQLISKRKEEGEYNLHPLFPYVSVKELNKGLISNLGVDFCIAATPPNVHIDDTQRAMELGIKTYVEKPAYPAGYGKQLRPVVEQAIVSGQVDLIDFFLGNQALIDFLQNPEHYLSGKLIDPELNLGEINFIHATCLEPHSVNEEGARKNMLMSFEAQGGFMYADQAPHPLAVINATLQATFGKSLDSSNTAMTFRSREVDVAGPKDAETSAAVLQVAQVFSEQTQTTKDIELLSVVGKGLKIPGGPEDLPAVNYMLTIGMENGQIDICLGNGRETLPCYLAIRPYDPSYQEQIFQYESSGLGYGTIMADFVIAAQATKQGKETPSNTRERIARQTSCSLSAMRTIENTYSQWDRSDDNIQLYGKNLDQKEAKLPAELPLACRVHWAIEEDQTKALNREMLKQ